MENNYGFVVLLDALGSKTASLTDAKRYIESVDRIRTYATYSYNASIKGSPKETDRKNDLTTILFGDTILMTLKITDSNEEYAVFEHLCFVLGEFINDSLKEGLLFRGSISIGDYVQNESIIMGPAVTDAATWYEQLDSIGAIFTPHATTVLKGMFLKAIQVTPSSEFTNWTNAILEFPPLKSGLELELFCLNWPLAAYTVFSLKSEIGINEIKIWMYDIFRKFPVPLGTEKKYKNTEQFFLKVIDSKNFSDCIKFNSARIKKAQETPA
jgi:hypothetical protein